MASVAIKYEADVFRQNDRKLFSIYNNLENGLRAAASQSGVIFDAISALFDYSTHEMVEEENRLLQCGYPEAQSHKKEHEYFKSTVNGYLSLVQFGSLPPAAEVRDFLAGWINRHVASSQVYDRR